MKNYEDFKEYYKRNPDKFIEDFYPDMKLYPYQKLMLKIMCGIDKVAKCLPWSRRRYR